MSEKYLVMTEAEFEAALSAQRRFTAHDSNDQDDEIRTDELWTRLQEAEAANDHEFCLINGTISDLLLDHADRFVQLGKVAAQMREQVHLPWVHPDLGYRPLYIDEDIVEAAAKLDKLMNGGEDDK